MVEATQVNVTVDDASASILYKPSGSWHSSAVPCSSCLNPAAFSPYDGTWHDGTHIVPTTDDDDTSSSASPTPSTHSAVLTPPPSTTPLPTASATGDDNGGGGGSANQGKGQGRKRDSDNPFATAKLDSDDPGFVDMPVTAQFNFTGYFPVFNARVQNA